MTARFIAVVGPSGAGKDTLLDAARSYFGEDGPIRFIRRVITRPAEAVGKAAGEAWGDAGGKSVGEDHEPCSVEDFHRRVADGAFAMHWGAHGLFYGIPADIDATLAQGRSVLANLSRTALPAFRERYADRRIIMVSASPDVLARRLAARGRESEAEIRERLARTVAQQPASPDMVTVMNDGAREDAIAAFLAILKDPAG